MRNRFGLLVICLLLVSILPLVGNDEADNKQLGQRIAELIEKLGDDNYFIRESASKELEKIGEPALETIKKALKESRDAEVRLRAAKIVENIEWLQRIKDLPRTFGERYYNWLREGKKVGYVKLAVKEAEYQGQPAFKLQSKWLLICLDGREGRIEMTTYAQKDRRLTPLYTEANWTYGGMEFEFKVKIKDSKGHLTGQGKSEGMEITVDKMIKVAKDIISVEGLIIGTTALPLREGLSFHYSLYELRTNVQVKRLKTQPIRFVGEEEVNFEGKKIRCHEFTTRIQGSQISFGDMKFWIDKDQRLIKAAGERGAFILTDRKDALKMPDQGKRKE